MKSWACAKGRYSLKIMIISATNQSMMGWLINIFRALAFHLSILSMFLVNLFGDWHLSHSCFMNFWRDIHKIWRANFNFKVGKEVVSRSVLFMNDGVFKFIIYDSLCFWRFCRRQLLDVSSFDGRFQTHTFPTFHLHIYHLTRLFSRTYRWYLFAFYTWAEGRRSGRQVKPKQWLHSAVWW